MKRSEFLKKLTLGIGVAVVAPKVIAPKEDKSIKGTVHEPEGGGFVYLPNGTLIVDSRTEEIERIIRIYKETGNLMYAYSGVPLTFSMPRKELIS